MSRRTAVVVGATGVTGRNLVHHLSGLEDWDVIGLSRRTPEFEARARFISVDLLDREDCDRKLGELTSATHVFIAGSRLAPPGPSTTRRTSPCW
jgi:nucleoside-diphosphate-sugar epimerase